MPLYIHGQPHRLTSNWKFTERNSIMAKSAKKTNFSVPAKTTIKKVKLQELVRGKEDITASDVWSFVRTHAGNQPSNVTIDTLDNVDASADKPFPFTNMTKDGRRSRIFWSMIQGVENVKGEKKSHRLDHFFKLLLHKHSHQPLIDGRASVLPSFLITITITITNEDD